MVVLAITVLLSAALFVMFLFARKTIKQEALETAGQTLEATVQQIDNVLLSLEQTSGNIYFEVISHLDQPERMPLYTRKLVETNPYITGSAIAFEPYYYKERGQYYLTYVHRAGSGDLRTVDSPIIQASTYGNVPYPEQVWYRQPTEKGTPCWINPTQDVDSGEAITSFCLPIYDGKRIVGVLGVDVSLDLLSDIVLAAKPSPNSYATLLGSDGSYIVHPDSAKRSGQTVFTVSEREMHPSAKEAAKAMVSGETGYKLFRMGGEDYYVFYKPYKRKEVPGRFTEDPGWSVGIIYPENDILGDYNLLHYVVLGIAIAGLLLLLVLCQIITHHQLKPLGLLTRSAQRIAKGHYDEPIPDARQQDEVGRLQRHFQQMQQSLAAKMAEMNLLTETLRERGETLAGAYEHAKEADRMKTAVLHNMTDQMIVPVNAIAADVEALCHHYKEQNQQESERLADDIQQQGKTVTELLDELLKSERKTDVRG